uniref:Uncharacterized protein n=1 Tax=Arion vulgaris TaxID=1028688 RepID=A0A0B7A1A6_9EUPU
MDNATYTPDSNEDSVNHQEVTQEERPDENEFDTIRKKVDPNVFCAPLNQGELSVTDKFSLAFLIIFPCFFFALGIVLTATLS